MKKRYYVNVQAQNNGDHEIHTELCPHMPNAGNARPLGMYETCYAAVREAAKHFNQVNGCIHCCTPCHTQ